MAGQTNKKLDKTGLAQVWTKIKENFVSKDELESVDTYTREETDTAIAEAVNQAVAGVYKVKGSVTFENIPVSGMRGGDVYNITNEFTASDTFVATEVGKHFPAGTNIVYTENGWDAMAGTYDFSEFMLKSELENISLEEINEICVMSKS